MHYSGANAWKKIGKVPNSPNSVSTTKAVVAERNIRSRSRHMKWSTTHAITKTTVAQTVLPESGPTASLRISRSRNASLASARW